MVYSSTSSKVNVLNGDGTFTAGKFMLAIFAALAEYDRERILRKTRAD